MKKVLYTLATLSFVFVACNKQEIVPEEGTSQEGELTTVTIKASNGDADTDTKAAISDALAFTWTTGDKIAVHTDAGRFYTSEALATGGASADFTVSLSGTRDGYAVYPASVAKSWSESTLTLTLPGTYTYAQVSGDNTPLPMIADNTSATLHFYHVAGLLRLSITNIPTGTNKIKLDFNGKKVSGDFTITSPVADGTDSSSSIAAADSETEGDDIIWITGIASPDPVTVNIPLPTGATYSDLIVSAWNDNVALRGQVVAFNTYTPARARGKKLSAALNLGAVSIASGKYAVFAPGNLVATITGVDDEGSPTYATGATWDFHTNQYDVVYLSTTSAVQSFAKGDKIDLFGWSTEKTYFGIHSSSDLNTYSGDSALPFIDWGTNAIGPYAAGTWRTPTAANSETANLTYLLAYRTCSTINSTSNAKYVKATVNGVRGLIIFPDIMSWPMIGDEPSPAYPGADTINEQVNNFTYIINSGEWSRLENAGCTFLPCAGYRTGVNIGHTSARDDSHLGYYWSSYSASNTYAYYMRFRHNTSGTGAGEVNSSTQGRWHTGKSIRLVRDLN